jgi:hypothetical protein
LRLLLFWTTVTTLPFWLIFIRGAFDGPTYQWGLFGFAGAGIDSDYWLPVAGTILALAMLILGWRGARAPFHWLLVAWHFLLAGLITYGAVTLGDQFRLQGDTLGLSVPLGQVGVVFFGGMAALVAYWVYRDLRFGGPREAPAWTAANRRWMWVLLGFLPVQLLLLRVGPPDGPADQAGVVLTIAQWFLLAEALKSRGSASPTDTRGSA